MTVLRVLEGVAGFALVVLVARDIFIGVVLPRPAGSRLTLSRPLVRAGWSLWRRLGGLRSDASRREHFLGVFAPLVLVLLLLTWMLGEVAGYALMVQALGADYSRVPSFADALWIASSSVLTVGTGDAVATGPLGRLVVVAAAATGLGTVALLITLLFSLYTHFQRREALVVTLDARAGAPPSGVTLLETYGRLRMVSRLSETFADWERWAAEVLDTHLAYPILGFFRSSHDNESWISALGAVLDAALLVVSTVDGDGVEKGPALQMIELGVHLVEDLAQQLGIAEEPDVGIEREEWEDARERLAQAGYHLMEAEAGWGKFSQVRARYAFRLNRLARFWATPPAQWIGDRTILGRHH